MLAEPPRLRLLAAYPYINPTVAQGLAKASPYVDFLLDSGAFTAWQAGKTIALDDYCRFIDGLPLAPWRYFTLDVVGDAAATRANYEAMRARKYQPIPIFTRGTGYAELDAYGATSDVVGIGGLAGKDGNRYAYLKAMMPHAGDHNLHILGITAPDWVKFFRPYSCDSSTWIAAGRYGKVNLYMGRGRFHTFRPRELDARPAGAMAARIDRYGFDPYALARTDKQWQRLNAMSWVEFAADVYAAIGTRLFLAVASSHDLALALDSYAKVIDLRPTIGEPAE